MGVDYSIAHALRLTSQLPPQSRCMRLIDPDPSWSEERAALERLDYHLEHLIWMLSKDGAKHINQPEPHEPPEVRKQLEGRLQQSLDDKAEVDRILGYRFT